MWWNSSWKYNVVYYLFTLIISIQYDVHIMHAHIHTSKQTFWHACTYNEHIMVCCDSKQTILVFHTTDPHKVVVTGPSNVSCQVSTGDSQVVCVKLLTYKLCIVWQNDCNTLYQRSVWHNKIQYWCSDSIHLLRFICPVCNFILDIRHCYLYTYLFVDVINKYMFHRITRSGHWPQ